MGGVLKKLGKKAARIVIVGLDSAGKTTIMYYFKLGELVSQTVPTLGFNMETITYKSVRMDCWDVGGQEAFRPTWPGFAADCKAVIFVIDSADLERIDEAKQELHKILAKIEKAALLIYANKQDRKGAVPGDELKARLDLSKRKAPTRIQPTTATSGEGVIEGLDWLVEQIK